MEQSRRDLFKGTLGLVGVLSGLSSRLVSLSTLPAFPPNGNPYFYGYKAYEYSVRSLRFNGEQDVIRELIRKGYPKSEAKNIVGDVSRLFKKYYMWEFKWHFQEEIF